MARETDPTGRDGRRLSGEDQWIGLERRVGLVGTGTEDSGYSPWYYK